MISSCGALMFTGCGGCWAPSPSEEQHPPMFARIRDRAWFFVQRKGRSTLGLDNCSFLEAQASSCRCQSGLNLLAQWKLTEKRKRCGEIVSCLKSMELSSTHTYRAASLV